MLSPLSSLPNFLDVCRPIRWQRLCLPECHCTRHHRQAVMPRTAADGTLRSGRPKIGRGWRCCGWSRGLLMRCLAGAAAVWALVAVLLMEFRVQSPSLKQDQ